MNMMAEPEMFSKSPTVQLRGELLHDVDMGRYVSWRAGGRADRAYRPADLEDLCNFLQTLPATEPISAIGLGSNLLVRDGGLRGTVLLLHAALTELRMESDGLIYAQAGVAGAKLARFAAQQHLSGAEFFAGIPGTVGGMLAMNAGCYGGQTWNQIQRVQVVGHDGIVRERTSEDYEIGYRHVKRVNDTALDEWFVGAWFRFTPGSGEESREAIKTLLNKRIASQPLQMPNAGSVFRNPPGGHAAQLIESCGLKGTRIGGAEVSHKHANFIVNTGGATAADIENLMGEIQAKVLQQTGIKLLPEVRILGDRRA